MSSALNSTLLTSWFTPAPARELMSNLSRLEGNDVEIVQVNGVARVRHNRADIAGEKIFVFSNTEHERTAAASADDKMRNIGMHQRDTVSADDLLERVAGGLDKARLRIGAVRAADK